RASWRLCDRKYRFASRPRLRDWRRFSHRSRLHAGGELSRRCGIVSRRGGDGDSGDFHRRQRHRGRRGGCNRRCPLQRGGCRGAGATTSLASFMSAPKSIPIAAPVLGGNELAYVQECLETTWISSIGRFIPAFEQSFASFCGAKHAIAVNNGTTALHLALVALGV